MEEKVAVVAIETKYPYTKEKKIWLLRRHRQSILPEVGMSVSSAEDYRVYIGGAHASRTSNRPLGRTIFSEEEERRLMPKVVGVSNSHIEWDSKLDEYWHNFLVAIPYGGMELNVSTRHINVEDRVGTPIDYFHYILYHYCLKYGEVANSKDDVSKSGRIRAYLWSREEQIKREKESQDLKDEAIIKRMQIQRDEVLVKDVLLLGGLPYTGTITELRIQLAKFSEEQPTTFLEIAKDKSITDKAMIERYIRVGFLYRPLGTTSVMYDNVPIAPNLDKAVLWLNLAENAVTKETLRVKYSQL